MPFIFIFSVLNIMLKGGRIEIAFVYYRLKDWKQAKLQLCVVIIDRLAENFDKNLNQKMIHLKWDFLNDVELS